MTMTVKNNIDAIRSLNMFNNNNSALQKSLSKLSSGMRIISGQDDASAYAISERMRFQIRGLEQCSNNVKNGHYLLNTAMGGLEKIKNSLERMAQLADQSSDAVMTDRDRANIQKEFSQLRENITDIAVGTNFNGQTPLHPLGKVKLDEPTDSGGKADIVFLVDTTSSMGWYIRNVASNMEKFVNSLTNSGIDYQIAVQTFNDQDINPLSYEAVVTGGPYDGQTMTFYRGQETALELDFTDDGDAVSNKLNEIAGGVGDAVQRGVGGHYEPESGLEGVKAALNVLQNGRENATKQIIVISDATFHDSSDTVGIENITSNTGGIGTAPDYYLNVNDVIDDLKSDKVRLSAVTMFVHTPYAGSNGLASDEWRQLTDATGGELLDLQSDDYGANLTTIARGTAEAAGVTEVADSNIEWRNVLKADNGFELGSAYIKDIHIHTGSKANQNIKISLYNHIDTMLKLDTLDISTRDRAVYARESLDIVIQKILDHSTEYGAIASRLEMTDENLSTAIENLMGAESTIRDLDMAQGMVNYARNNLLMQASQAMLAQANQNSSAVLGLLQ